MRMTSREHDWTGEIWGCHITSLCHSLGSKMGSPTLPLIIPMTSRLLPVLRDGNQLRFTLILTQACIPKGHPWVLCPRQTLQQLETAAVQAARRARLPWMMSGG